MAGELDMGKWKGGFVHGSGGSSTWVLLLMLFTVSAISIQGM